MTAADPADPSALSRSIVLRGRRFHYLDFSPGASAADSRVPVVALHGHFGCAAQWAPLARALGPRYRVLALDQRGHGRTARYPGGRGGGFGRDAYVADAAAFVRALRLGPVAVLGHSMGGVTAFQLAARRPGLVRAVVNEEGGAVNEPPAVAHPTVDVTGWPARAADRRELADGLAAAGLPERLVGYVMASAVREPDGGGWRFAWDAADMMASQRALVGSWWPDWEAVRCPVLLLHGTAGSVVPTAVAREMARRLPAASLVEFPGAGHWVHDEEPDGFARAVAGFLDRL